MSVFTKLTWPIVDTSAVCASQTIPVISTFPIPQVGGNLLLNGTFFNSSVPDQVSLIDQRVIRSVSITSSNNLSGLPFVISGFQNNAPVQETISGPNNGTVYGLKHFDVITSVFIPTTTGGGGTVQVGVGNTGYFPLLVVNSNISTTINYSMSVLFPPTVITNINYSVYQTLDQINSNFITFDNQLNNLFPITGLINQTSSQIASFKDVTNFILLKVNSSGTPLTDTFDFIFLQAN